MTTCALEGRGRHHVQRNLLKQTIQTSCRWMLIPCSVKVAKGGQARVKVKTKVTDPDTTAKAKGKQSVKQRYFDGYCNQCGEYGHKKPDCAGKNKFFKEPTGIESLEWLYAVEHDGETMASLTDAPVRLLLDSGSGVSACSPEFAPHVKTLTGSSVRARSATGQVTKSLGKKTVNFDINGIAAGVNMEVLKISKQIVSAGKMVRSG